MSPRWRRSFASILNYTYGAISVGKTHGKKSTVSCGLEIEFKYLPPAP